MKIILFEGPDKVGKSTLLLNLGDKMAFGETDEFGSKHKPLWLGCAFGTHPVYGADEQNKLRSFRLGLEAESIETMIEMLPEEYVLLVDRFHLSEKVYGNLFKRGWDQGQFEGIDRLFQDALLVKITPTNPVPLFEKFRDETGRLDGFTSAEYEKSVCLFNEVFEESCIKNKFEAYVKTSWIESEWERPDEQVQQAVINYLRS